jgi:hypothetical protein
MHYTQLTLTTDLPDLASLRPFKAILVIEESLAAERQLEIGRWLVESGCLYAMAWGNESGRWQDAIQAANADAFDTDEIPDDRLIIATSHEDEPLPEVFWFSKYTAMHPCVDLDNVVLLHLASAARERELGEAYAAV